MDWALSRKSPGKRDGETVSEGRTALRMYFQHDKVTNGGRGIIWKNVHW